MGHRIQAKYKLQLRVTKLISALGPSQQLQVENKRKEKHVLEYYTNNLH